MAKRIVVRWQNRIQTFILLKYIDNKYVCVVFIGVKGCFMFKKLKQKKKEFDDKVMMVVYCQQGIVSNLLQKIPYDLVFKTTHWC